MNVRVCPECGEEFRPEIVHCSDCGALLVDHAAEEVAPSPMAGSPTGQAHSPSDGAPAPVAFARLVRADRAAAIEPLAERLGKAGVPFRVRTVSLSFELLVAEGDREEALSVLGDAARPENVSVDDAPFDPEGGYAACPACGSRLAPRAQECPECGLAVGGEPDAETRGPLDEEP
jgi:hypothetical protein